MKRDEYDRFLTATYGVLALLVIVQLINLLVLPVPAAIVGATTLLGFIGMGIYGLLVGQSHPDTDPTAGRGKADRR